MAFLFRDDKSFDMGRRLTGFDRYRQLMSLCAFHWIKINFITIAGALPLAAGIAWALLSSSVLVLIPASILGGMIFGPFLAGMYDAVMRGLRDMLGNWWMHYKKAWRQNWRSSLLPGALTGLIMGILVFMLYIMWNANATPGYGTIAMYVVCIFFTLLVGTLYWPQLVLFEQTNFIRMKNVLLFMIKHSKRVFFVTLLQLAYVAVYVLFAPWTVLLVPITGFWFIIFVAQYKLYDFMNADYRIEEQFRPIEGDPWAEDRFETGDEE